MERKIVNPWKWQDQYGFVQANEVTGAERTLYCAGQTSVDAEGNPVHARDMRAQITQALDNLDAVLGAAGFGMSDVVRLNLFTTDVDQTMEAWPLIKSRLAQAGCRQASTLLGVARLYHPDILIETRPLRFDRVGGLSLIRGRGDAPLWRDGCPSTGVRARGQRAGCQLWGSSSLMRLFRCVGKRVSTPAAP